MKAVHFGAGNIGRGFVGLILHHAGYEVVFADVAAPLIDALAASDSYRVEEVGADPKSWTVDNYRALNSATDEQGVVDEIATADIVTTAVGPNILRFVAPLIARALEQRADSAAPLTVMACENAINATDILEAEVLGKLEEHGDDWIVDRAVFANTAVDRIVPAQAADAGLDVTVEDFFEWAIESPPFRGDPPAIPEAHFVDDLAPYIERKLFTVNTGHATTAYYGFLVGAATLSDAIADPSVRSEVEAVLAETSDLLVMKHGFDAATHQEYVDRTLVRFSNPHLPDTPERVGRQPLRKLSRNERLVGPAAALIEASRPADALVRAMGAASRFDVEEDPESVRLQELMRTLSADDLTAEVTGLERGSALFGQVSDAIQAAQSEQGDEV